MTGWTQHSGNIWKAPLNRANKLRALYVNDKRAFMASKTISSAGCYGTYNITAGQAPVGLGVGFAVRRRQVQPGRFSRHRRQPGRHRDRNGDDLDHGHRGSPPGHHLDGANRVALFQQPGAAIAQGAFNGNAQVGGTHKVMNAYEFLDTPGEFFFDKTSRTLYYYKASSENMTTATVFAPNNVTTVLRIAGTSTSSHARNITFSGLTVQHSDWNLFNVAGSAFKQAQQGNLGAPRTPRTTSTSTTTAMST